MGNFRSLTGYADNFGVNFTIMALIIAGGIGFIVLGEVYDKVRHGKRMSLHSKIALIMTVMLILIGALFFAVMESGNAATLAPLSLKGKILSSFSSLYLQEQPALTQLILAGLQKQPCFCL